jgi:predicted CXXCH cytochrome family protein
MEGLMRRSTLLARRAIFALCGASALSLGACIDEKIVFRDRELFQEPLAAAGSFLGYIDREDKLTVCGNCHIGVQREWVVTKHASAWKGLEDSGHAATSCQGCHTVSELGNVATGTVGHAATGEERYQDVQCESCHGPGLVHVLDPNDGTVPLAAMDVGADMTTGCSECHRGTHRPFLEEWSQSGHGSVVASPAGRAECQSCHTGEGALAMFGVRTAYVEQDDVAGLDQHLAITCAVCHDPHGSDYSGQLRFPIDVPDEDQNLCMICHNRRGTPDPTRSSGPHAPEGPTVLGVAGWWPPNLTFPGGRMVGTHGSADANPRLCASCHVQTFELTDPETGELVLQSTGHLFEATPCLDSNGTPIQGDCDDEDRSYASCGAAGCHTVPGSAQSLRQVTETRIARHVAELDALIDAIPSSEFNSGDDRYTVGEGSRFNLRLAQAGGAAVHNPFLIEALLLASIDAVETTYGLPAPAQASSIMLHGGR